MEFKMFNLRFIITLFLFSIFSSTSLSQELVFNPINPSFVGGNPFNAQWLLAEATAQNTMEEKREQESYLRDPIEDFEESIKRQILNQITRNLFEDSFGEESLKEGRYEFGDFLVDVSPTNEGLLIYILDNSTGGETSILIPYF